MILIFEIHDGFINWDPYVLVFDVKCHTTTAVTVCARSKLETVQILIERRVRVGDPNYLEIV
jgi:hypothetical protein